MNMDEYRQPYKVHNKNTVMAVGSSFAHRRTHDMIPPSDLMLNVFAQRRQPFDLPTVSPCEYEPFLLNDAFYWMDLTGHPRVQQLNANQIRITTGHTLWGKVALHWLQRGYCYHVGKQTRDWLLTMEYYESWWRTRHDGIRKCVFKSLARTDSHFAHSLKRDMARFKLTATEGPLRYMP